MRANAITALLSGPAAGVVGAGAAGRPLRLSQPRSPSTSAAPPPTSAWSTDGVPQLTHEFSDRRAAGPHPGARHQHRRRRRRSIIWVDEGGMLRVGPHSRRRRSGTGLLRPRAARSRPSPTRMSFARHDPARGLPRRAHAPSMPTAARARSSRSRSHFGMTRRGVQPTAPLQLANANIVRAIQLISTERGHDPRDYVLVPFGGAGPLHAAPGRRDLGIARLWFRRISGVISAYGLLACGLRAVREHDPARACRRSRAPQSSARVFREMRERALGRAKGVGLSGEFRSSFVADGHALRRPGLRGAGGARGGRFRVRLTRRAAAPRCSARRTSASTSSAVKRESRSSSSSFRLGVMAPLDGIAGADARRRRPSPRGRSTHLRRASLARRRSCSRARSNGRSRYRAPR